jgi:glycosyltransferase involved in cell wall biosynthesis
MVAYTHYQTDPRCRREAELCAENGWEVDFYALKTTEQGSQLQKSGVNVIEAGMGRYRGDSPVKYMLSYIEFLLRVSVMVFSNHLRNRYDVIHVNTMPDFMVFTALFPKLFGAKVILDVHDVMPEIYMTKFGLGKNHWKIRLIRSIEVFSAKVANAVLAAEHPKGELLVEHGVPEEKVSVLLNLPDDSIFPMNKEKPTDLPKSPDDEFKLIYHGTLAHRLGLDLAVSAMPAVLKKYSGATLRIIGDGDHLPELHRMVDELELNNSVTFSDAFLPLETILPELQAAHLAVIPTRHEISTDYMLPTKLIEYLRLGIPSVVTPTRTVKYYFGDSRPNYLEDTTPEVVANAIIRARQDYDKIMSDTLVMQHDFFSKYDWPVHKQSYLDLLDKLTKGRK